jgi:dehydrogenase/reductase SDR family protein 4
MALEIFSLSNNFTMLKNTTLVLTRHFLLTSQNFRQIGTAAEVARQRRSLKDRVAIITASTDGSILFS